MFSSGVSEQTSLHINAAGRKKNEAMDEQDEQKTQQRWGNSIERKTRLPISITLYKYKLAKK